jgi:hypothetical protein
MTTPTNDDARRHGGWQRRMQDREALRRTAAAHEPVVTETAEAHWLDDGGAAEERRDRVSFRDVR